jgi:hypothetical protein
MNTFEERGPLPGADANALYPADAFATEGYSARRARRQLKLDSYRALAIKSGARIQLRSGNDNDFSTRYRDIAKALAVLPDDTVIDGEVVALDEDGRPSFTLLQNYGSTGAQIVYDVFDVLVLAVAMSCANHSTSGVRCSKSSASNTFWFL